MTQNKTTHLFISTPTGIFFEGDVELVILSTISGGNITLMPNRTQFMSNIAVGKLLINSVGHPEHKVCAIGGGIVYADAKQIKIITDDIVYDKDIVLSWAEQQRDNALEHMKSATADEYAKYEAQLRKAISKINIYNGQK
ncbi:ATP synthase F1 subunit epsilon [Mycoplasmopsis californica]|uniref:ATP synthase epsilon chain n=1 Tax=Mycoplasmopsis californica TaxID=2113 RepID=A0A059XW88_9BACT|nr:hypothetical protein [Mycoplasmopsis californica]AIA29591.1 ATP synthase F1 subunit epsilon [Mycoplasmopsis californica]